MAGAISTVATDKTLPQVKESPEGQGHVFKRSVLESQSMWLQTLHDHIFQALQEHAVMASAVDGLNNAANVAGSAAPWCEAEYAHHIL